MKKEPFDRLLERASRPLGRARPDDGCLDGETIAAWTEGALTDAARAKAEAHAADCDRCLAVLAAVAKTAPPPSVADRRAWFSVRWLVPLATAAVAITAWVVVRNPEAPLAPAAPPVQQVDALKTVPAGAPADSPPPARDAQAQARTAPERTQETLSRPSSETAAKTTANEVAKQVAPPSAPAAAPPPVAAATRQERFAALDSISVPTIVASPDPGVRWRFSGVTVERSIDGGATWHRERVIPIMEIAAGSAPDPRICWLVGRGGEAWLTTDGGSTWQRLDFPDKTVDLVSVAARDALSATVTTKAGSSYRTDDGGKTWRAQENAAAPF